MPALFLHISNIVIILILKIINVLYSIKRLDDNIMEGMKIGKLVTQNEYSATCKDCVTEIYSKVNDTVWVNVE